MEERLFAAEAFEEFCHAFTEQMNHLRREHRAKAAAAPREIADIERRQLDILRWLSGGLGTVDVYQREVKQLEDRKNELKAVVAAADREPPLPALHPHMADVFRQKTETLAAALELDEEHNAAREALRGFLDKIIIPPDDGPLQVVGNFGEMLTAASGWNGSTLAAVGYGGCGGGI